MSTIPASSLSKNRYFLKIAWLSLLLTTSAGFAEPESQGIHSTADAGGVGLLQMPTARFGGDGYFSFGISRQLPFDNLHLTLQALPWLEGVFRYSDIRNRLYSDDPSFSGDQTLKDRGFDLKLRLLEESGDFPAVSLGIRDFAGTGLFSGEYLVASRRFYNLDLTLGLAWGRPGARGGLDNPFTIFSDKFAQRGGTLDRGGSVQTNRWFRGEEIALFGGLEWATPLRGLTLKIEYDGNDYQSEAGGENLRAASPVNAGLNYKLWNSVDLGLGYERGNTLMLRFALFSNLERDTGPPKIFDPSPPPVTQYPVLFDSVAEFTHSLQQAAEQQKLGVQAVDFRHDGRSLEVWYRNGVYRNQAKALGRMSRVLAGLAPPEIESFTLTSVNAGVSTAEATLQRREVERAARYQSTVEEVWSQARLGSPQADRDLASHPLPADCPEFGFGMSPALRQHIGGPDAFYFYQLWWRVTGRLELTEQLSVSGAVGFNIHNNFDGLRLRSDSQLPRVRSDIAQYLKEGENNLVRLEGNYIGSPAPDWYARLSAGIFEEMYGGVAGEILYRPYGRRWALGANANRVRQREFDQRFDFRDYEVTTGHLTLYYQPPWYNTLLRWSAGRYLAGDAGTTIDFSRQFANGVRAGIFATFTDVSAAEFGEGSFDKGFYFGVPLDVFFAKSSRRHVGLSFRPLTRDGGQKVRDGQELYPLLDGTDPGALARGWSGFLD